MKPRDGERGLTLLEVVIALMLFALMAMLLLSGQGEAIERIAEAEAARDIAYLLPYRLRMVALDHEAYEDDQQGEFPSTVKNEFVDEDDIFGEQYKGYTWVLEKREVTAAGTQGTVEIEGDSYDMLFPEEGALGGGLGGEGGGLPVDEESEDPEQVEADDVARMLLIKVTVYPPGFEPGVEVPEEERGRVGPRSAWTAILIPTEEDTDDGGSGG